MVTKSKHNRNTCSRSYQQCQCHLGFSWNYLSSGQETVNQHRLLFRKRKRAWGKTLLALSMSNTDSLGRGGRGGLVLQSSCQVVNIFTVAVTLEPVKRFQKFPVSHWDNSHFKTPKTSDWWKMSRKGWIRSSDFQDSVVLRCHPAHKTDGAFQWRPSCCPAASLCHPQASPLRESSRCSHRRRSRERVCRQRGRQREWKTKKMEDMRGTKLTNF